MWRQPAKLSRITLGKFESTAKTIVEIGDSWVMATRPPQHRLRSVKIVFPNQTEAMTCMIPKTVNFLSHRAAFHVFS
jgi:hypothetical protein